ncbi:MAG: hypothetical protein LBD96_02535 [Treponema sp.]|jgi:hypothetical protein|nr:hypothetical protein [Treponema sp.]
MLYPKNRFPSLPDELFQNPGAEYRGAPFWSWNTRISGELVTGQAEIFRRMGFGGFHIHPRTGLETAYMGEEFLRMVKLADDFAVKNQMLCWLYDEDRYPSGAAGGMVTGDITTRARYLRLSSSLHPDFCKTREDFNREIAAGAKPRGYYIASYETELEGGYLTFYRRTERKEKAARGRLWHAAVELEQESPWFNDQTYLDTMNRRAVERFISLTHEAYYRVLGGEFGKSVPAIFTDEPNIRGRMTLPFAESTGEATLPFTDDFNETFRAAFGYDMLDILPELLWELPGGKPSVHRWRYHDHVAERFVSAFTDTLGAWCENHHIALTGHFLSERTLYQQTLRLGEAMRCYRAFQLPGIDILIDDKELSTAKQASSVSAQYGREGTMSELYGVTQWDFDFKGYKLQGDWQAALGISIRCPHLSFMSMEGEAKRDWPASIFYQSPWWEKYPLIENHFARLNTALTRGNPLRRLAIIHPIESFWLSFGPNDQTRDTRARQDEDFENLLHWLLYGLIDFDFISESLLPGLCERADAALRVGHMAYSVILVPRCRTLRHSTLERLEAFRAAGGCLIFAGEIADLADAEPSGRARDLAEKSFTCAYSRDAILNALSPYRDIEVRYGKTRALVMGKPLPEGQAADNLFYQMRRDGDERWLFLCHVNRRRNRNGSPEQYTLRIKGRWQLTLYNTMSGGIYPVAAEYRGEDTWAALNLYAEDSVLFRLETPKTETLKQETPKTEPPKEKGNGDPPATVWVQPALPDRAPLIIEAPQACRLSEPNDLILDYARCSLDGGEIGPRTEILRLDNQLRATLGFPRRQDAATQPWRIPDETPKHRILLCYDFESDIALEGCFLGIERPEEARVRLNGETTQGDAGYYTDSFIRKLPLPPFRQGLNRLEIEMPFGRKSNLEALHVLGDFGVDIGGRPRIVAPPALSGFGDTTYQHLPFYTGNIIYQMSFTLDSPGSVRIVVPHFSAPVLEVSVDGIARGLIAFSPHQLQVEGLGRGIHKLEICSFGSRFNGFGPLHNANDEYNWYGPDSYRTTGDEWTEAYRIRPAGILSRVEVYQACQEDKG